MRYVVNRVEKEPDLGESFDGGVWSAANCGTVENFRPESSGHRPLTRFRVVHNGTRVFVRFEINDCYVRSVQTERQASVCTDSCTEFFLQPKPDKGYFNFEVNAGGAILLSYVEDHERTRDGFKKWQSVADELIDEIEIWHSLPSVVEPEITEPVVWGNGWSFPVSLLEAYVGSLGDITGAVWRGNFYKCADRTSQPHWGSWSPVDKLNFHLPECFGDIELGR
ncbi:MAG: hypothetical protein GX230_09195 [Lentisphaerae bacterium]|nr:hypothetical protein [Lentisphaerota bacterium]